MYNRLNAFLIKHKIFYKYQFGFRKNHATADALSEVIDFMYQSSYSVYIYICDHLTINYDPKKSSYCIFKPRNKSFPPNYNRGLKIGINTLTFKETTKYLGLLLDSKLTWENHIQELNKKMVKYTGIFSKVRHYLPITCCKTVYNAFMFSRLSYGSEIYFNTTKKYINPLIVTQNKLSRIIQFKNIRTPLKDLHREFNTIISSLHAFKPKLNQYLHDKYQNISPMTKDFHKIHNTLHILQINYISNINCNHILLRCYFFQFCMYA